MAKGFLLAFHCLKQQDINTGLYTWLLLPSGSKHYLGKEAVGRLTTLTHPQVLFDETRFQILWESPGYFSKTEIKTLQTITMGNLVLKRPRWKHRGYSKCTSSLFRSLGSGVCQFSLSHSQALRSVLVICSSRQLTSSHPHTLCKPVPHSFAKDTDASLGRS